MYGLNNSGEGAVLALTRHFLVCIWRSAYLKTVSNFRRQRRLTSLSKVSNLLTGAIARKLEFPYITLKIKMHLIPCKMENFFWKLEIL